MKLAFANGTSRKARVEMIPLIDAMFLLLTFFIYAILSMTTHKGLPVNVPEAVTAVREDPAEITITVPKENGRVFIDKTPVPMDRLVGALESRAFQNSELTVFINADQDAPHGRVISVLDAARRAGLEKVAFEVEGPSAPNEAPNRSRTGRAGPEE